MALLVSLSVGAFLLTHASLPHGQSGPEADALARKIEHAVNIAAWQRTGAVRWTFADRHHLWDRQRALARVQWDELEIQLDLEHNTGLAWRAGHKVDGQQSVELISSARSYWTNDSFWLNPLAKLFDVGTIRQLVVQADGSRELLITYTTGGDTPGDSYLWQLEDDGRPHAWEMWVSIIPIGGIGTTWQQWKQLATGAWISERHRFLFFDIQLTDVAGATDLAALVGDDDPLTAIALHRREKQ